MVWVGIIALILSAISIGVAVVALIKNQRTQNQMLQIDNRMLQIEQTRERDRQDKVRRAVLTTKFEHLQQHGHYALHIENSGASEARDVTVKIDGKPISELKKIEPKIPQVPTIGPDSTFSYHWPTANNPRPPFPLEIAWSDDSKEPGRYNTTLMHPTTPT